MQNTNGIRHLSSYDTHLVFRVIHCNPLAMRGNPERSQQRLTLVWGKSLANNKPKGVKKTLPTPASVTPQSWPERHSGALSLISLIVVVLLTIFNIGYISGVW